MNREKPILFNTPMVQAILAGHKTTTRRMVKDADPSWDFIDLDNNAAILKVRANGEEYPVDVDGLWAGFEDLNGVVEFPMIKAPYQTGDILWVRETWFHGYIESSDAEGSNERWFEECAENKGGYLKAISGYLFKATIDDMIARYDDIDNETVRTIRWRPSIHMPRKIARIFLRVTNVRVERVQDIDDAGAKAEGANILDGKNVGFEEKMRRGAVERFRELWDGLYAKSGNGWDANPWVWVIEFEKCENPEREAQPI